MSDSEWLERVAHLNQWKARGRRAPHKPLLLLYMIGRLQRLGTAGVDFREAEPELQLLLDEFGPPNKSTPAYPFHHLMSDGLWVVKGPNGEDSPGPQVSLLRLGYRGELTSDFAQALERSPHLLSDVALSLLNMQFPPTIHEDILQAVGLELLTPPNLAYELPDHRPRRRDPTFRERVLTAYEFRCAACGYEGTLGREAIGVEAAHVRWWAAAGPDDVSNGIALCSIHHKLLDRGAIGITDDLKVAVSQHFLGNSDAARQLVLSLVEQPISSPQPGHDPPRRSHILWHRDQVFRAPARMLRQGDPPDL